MSKRCDQTANEGETLMQEQNLVLLRIKQHCKLDLYLLARQDFVNISQQWIIMIASRIWKVNGSSITSPPHFKLSPLFISLTHLDLSGSSCISLLLSSPNLSITSSFTITDYIRPFASDILIQTCINMLSFDTRRALERLPPELKVMILSYCDASSRGNLGATSKSIRNFIMREHFGAVRFEGYQPQLIQALGSFLVDPEEASIEDARTYVLWVITVFCSQDKVLTLL